MYVSEPYLLSFVSRARRFFSSERYAHSRQQYGPYGLATHMFRPTYPSRLPQASHFGKSSIPSRTHATFVGVLYSGDASVGSCSSTHRLSPAYGRSGETPAASSRFFPVASSFLWYDFGYASTSVRS